MANNITTFTNDSDRYVNPIVAKMKTPIPIMMTFSLPILSAITPKGYDTAVYIMLYKTYNNITSISLRPVSFAFKMKNDMLKFANANIEDTSRKNFNLESKDLNP